MCVRGEYDSEEWQPNKQNKQLNGTKLNGVESLPWTTDYATPTQRRAYVGPGTIRPRAATQDGARDPSREITIGT